jgi:hypothetical protein
MSLLLNEPDFYYTSILNEETLNSSIINLNGVSGVLKGVNNAIEGSSTTDDLPEGKTNQYFTNARAQGAFTGGSGIVITSGTISNTGVLSLTGTANRITVSGSTGNITLSGPQDLNTTSNPTFNNLSLSNLRMPTYYNCLLSADVGGNVLNASTSANLSYNTTFRTLDTVQGIQTTSTPTFAGLTLTGTLTGTRVSLSGMVPLNLPLGNFSNSILYCDSSVAGDVNPLGISANLKITGSSGSYVLDTKQNLQTTSTPTFAGLTLGTLSGVLKATAGVISNGATTDNLTEGKTNLYFTNARAQGALSAGTGISITSGTIANTGITAITAGTNITTSNTGGSYTINTTTNPTFSVGATIGTLNITNMNSNITNGVSLGTSAGTSGNYNAYIGTQAGTGSIGSGNVGIGYQALAGAGSGCFGLGFTAGYQALTNGNIAIGGSTGQNILTGSGYNIYIGGAPSSSSASYETVIGTSASAPVGKGDNTCYISNSAGLYHYIPYSINLWNNNAGTVSQVEQWVLNNTANSGIANIGTTPTITSGVITNIPVGVYSFNITGSLYGSNQTYYPTLQYKANGGSFVRVALAMPSFGGAWTCPIAINANIRISNTADAIRLWYDTGTPYSNTGTIPAIYYGNYLPRYMTITFISL